MALGGAAVPELNRRQFTQEPIEGFYGSAATPHGLKGRLPARADAPDDGLGPDTKRGVVGEGQQMLNFDHPDRQLETGRAGLVGVDRFADPGWDNSSWKFGGMHRVDPLRRSPDFGPYSGDQDEVITAGWERAPVETIGPDDEVRTNQIDYELHDDGRPEVEHTPEHVEDLRAEGDLVFQDPDTGTEQFPWVAQVEGKRYLMEGHHRTIAARTRGDGSFPAHVLRGGNWGQIEEQIYDGPRER